jgi:hypothetical protein
MPVWPEAALLSLLSSSRPSHASVSPFTFNRMSRLRAVLSASWRSCARRTLDRTAGLCLSASLRLMALRERVAPTGAELTPERADRILTGVLARIAQPTFHPSQDDNAAASLAYSIQATVWTYRRDDGVMAVAVQKSSGIA